MPSATDIFDYVIIGGGTAGALLTNRLSKDAASVCLLEAGPRDTNPLIHIPAGYIRNVYSKRLTWGFEAEPSAGTGSITTAGKAQTLTIGQSVAIRVGPITKCFPIFVAANAGLVKLMSATGGARVRCR